MNTRGYTLGILKDCIYKELDEFSFNGDETGFSDSYKSDLELRMLYAINSSATRVLTSVSTLSKNFYALLKEPPVVFFKQNISAVEFSFTPEQSFTNLALHFYYTGLCEISILAKDGSVIFNGTVSSLGNKLSEYKKIVTSQSPIALITLKNPSADLCVSDFVIRNVQDFDCSENLISPYGQVSVCLPENVYEITSVIANGHLLCENDYYVQDNTFFCNHKYTGKALISYRPSAPVFTVNSQDDEPIDLSDAICLAIIYLAAAQLCPEHNGQRYSKLMANYQNIISNHYNCESKKNNVVNSFYRHTRKLFGRR